MSSFDDWLVNPQVSSSTVPAKEGRTIDADTLKVLHPDTGEEISIRSRVGNAREIARVNGGFKEGQYGGEVQADAVNRLANEGGFNTVELKRDANNKPIRDKSKGDRYLGTLVNDDGVRLDDEAVRQGIVGTGDLYGNAEDRTLRAMQQMKVADRRAKGLPQTSLTLLGQELQASVNDAITYKGNAASIQAKPWAPTSAHYRADPNAYVGIGQRQEGEDYQGYSTSPFSQGLLDTGVDLVKAQGYGALNILGDIIGSKSTSDYAQGKVEQIEYDNAFAPGLRRLLNDRGELQLKDAGEFADWFKGMAGTTLPSIGINVGALLLAAPTGGASLSIPGMLYAGDVYNKQPKDKKDIGDALLFGAGMAALDLIPVSGALSKAAGTVSRIGLHTAAGRTAAVEALVKNGVPKAAAEKQVADAFQTTTSKLMKGLGSFAKGAGMEGATEATQDLLGNIGAGGGLKALANKPEQFFDESSRAQYLESFISGAVLGGPMDATAGVVGKFTSEPEGGFKASAKSDDVVRREALAKANNGVVPTGAEIRDKIAAGNLAHEPAAPKALTNRTFYQTVQDSIAHHGVLGSLTSTWKGAFQSEGEGGAYVRSALGLSNELDNNNYVIEQQKVTGGILAAFGTEESFYNQFPDLDRRGVANLFRKSTVNGYARDLMDALTARRGDLESAVKSVKESKLGEDAQYATQIQDAALRFYKANQAAVRHGSPGKDIKEMFTNRSFNKDTVRSKRKKLEGLLVSEQGLTPVQAKKMVTDILDNSNIDSVEDLNDVFGFGDVDKPTKDSVIAKANLKHSKFAEFMHDDIYGDIVSYASTTGRRYVEKNILGKNGELLAAAVMADVRSGAISKEEGDYQLNEINDFVKIRNGEYNKISNPFVRGVLDGISFLTAIAVMPLAAVSSIVEFSQVMRSIEKDKDGIRTSLVNMTVATAKEMASAMRDVGQALTGDKIRGKFEWEHRKMLLENGFPLGASHTIRRNDIQVGTMQRLTIAFFRINMLEGVTNATRFARLALADSAINNWLNHYKADKDSVLGREAEENLVRIGLNPDKMLEAAGNPTKKNLALLENYMTSARIAFVNEAVLQPSITNRPKFYSNPYLRLFTQLQGYTSTATATLLPRLYKDLKANGTREQRDAMQTVLLTVAMSMLAIALKELLKGEDENAKKKRSEETLKLNLHRVLSTSGLLGAYQGAFNTVFPMFEQSVTLADEPVKWMGQRIVGASPQLGYVSNVASAIDEVVNGNNAEKAAKKVVKVTPFGSVTSTHVPKIYDAIFK